MSQVVVLDAAGGIAEQIRWALKGENLSVERVADAAEASRELGGDASLLVMNPCVQPDMSFIPLEGLAREVGETPLMIVTGCAPVEEAARVLFPQARSVVRLPLSPMDLRDEILGAVVKRGGNGNGRSALNGLGGIVGCSSAMQEVYRGIQMAAASDTTVLLTGETGTGKELVAKTIHERSSRRRGPFVVVGCAELPETLIESELFGHAKGSFTGAGSDKIGLFEAAQGGTVLLDEMGDASPGLQARLLRIVEERKVRRVGEVRTRDLDVRLIAAAQESLPERVAAGSFRRDLFYRLQVLHIPLPPLRERSEDIPLLVQHSLAGGGKFTAARPRISPLAMEILRAHPWPGNVRELFSAVEAALIAQSNGHLTVPDLPKEVTAHWRENGGDQGEAVRIVAALREVNGNRAEAAKMLGVSRTTLWRLMTRLGISADEGIP